MLDWFKKRLKEPSTYVGGGLLAQAALILTKADPVHTDLVGNVFAQAAEPLSRGDYTTGLTIGLAGLLGVLMGEKAR